MDRNDIIHFLEIARGQIGGIIKMLEEGEYCIDISNQMLATTGLIKKANTMLLDQHLKHCVLNATDREERETKLDQMIQIALETI